MRWPAFIAEGSMSRILRWLFYSHDEVILPPSDCRHRSHIPRGGKDALFIFLFCRGITRYLTADTFDSVGDRLAFLLPPFSQVSPSIRTHIGRRSGITWVSRNIKDLLSLFPSSAPGIRNVQRKRKGAVKGTGENEPPFPFSPPSSLSDRPLCRR